MSQVFVALVWSSSELHMSDTRYVNDIMKCCLAGPVHASDKSIAGAALRASADPSP